MRKPYIFLWVGVIVLFGFFWIYFPTLSRYRDFKLDEEKINRDVDDFNKKIAELEEEKNLLQNDKEHLEKVIREELGLVRPGEVVYKFVPDQRTPEEIAAQPSASSVPAVEETVTPSLPRS